MISSPSNLLTDLFDRQKHELPPEQLRWLGNLSTEAQAQLMQLAESLQLLAGIIADGDAISAPDEAGLGQILYGMSEKAKDILAMIIIAEEAEQLADKADLIQDTIRSPRQ